MEREKMKTLISLRNKLTINNLVFVDYGHVPGWEVTEEEAEIIRSCTGGKVESRYRLGKDDFFMYDEPLLACVIVTYRDGGVFVCPTKLEMFIHQLDVITTFYVACKMSEEERRAINERV